MKNSIKPVANTVHAMTQNNGINANSRWGKLMTMAKQWSAAEDKLDGDTEDFARDVDDLATRINDAVKRHCR